MAKLYFRYGAMGSSKTANALMVRYNYLERGSRAHLLKPKLENRDGEKIIRSRIGMEAECDFVEDFIEEIGDDWEKAKVYDAIVVDEAQFLSKEQADWFSDLVDFADIPVICYGLILRIYPLSVTASGRISRACFFRDPCGCLRSRIR